MKKCVSVYLVFCICFSVFIPVFGFDSDVVPISDLISVEYPISDLIPVEVSPAVGRIDISTFTDISTSHWAYNEFSSLLERGVVRGVSSNLLAPDSLLTREQFVVMFCRNMTNSDWGMSESPYYIDVNPLSWYVGGVEWARNSGVVVGVGSDSFGVGQFITKEQLVQMLYNYVKHNDIPLKSTSALDSPISDMSLVSDWAFSGVSWGNVTGLLVKDSLGNYNPQSFATRSDMAVTLFRFNSLLLS